MTEIIHDMQLTETTIALMRYAKRADSDFAWKSICDNVLGELYHDDMRMADVCHVVLKSWQNARNEPRLQMSYDNATAMSKLMFSPLERLDLFMQIENVYSLESVYQTFLDYMMHDLRLTRIDWLQDQFKFNE